MVRDIRCSEQNAVEVDAVVIDPVLHRWDEAQKLRGTGSTSADPPIDTCCDVGQTCMVEWHCDNAMLRRGFAQALG